ncbi:MAG TPA: glycosyltransferase family 2 protein [Candidatus Limnocylindrales bacterium]|nr:glycosyltransferase family 2 protein [Candidatus Limnocylindrales bacterium]
MTDRDQASDSPSRRPAGTASRIKVSVVVPVHDTGRYLEASVASILAQTLPADEFEAVFVDDGSTDGSAERLDRVAEQARNVRVVHLPASGAPGRPRNVGIDAARGDFIQFLDSDDELAPDALERLYAMASRHGTDIVLGKFASASMPRRQDLFARTRGRCTIVDTPGVVDGSLGPTKLFRTALLRRHRIRFAEGWRRMEDQYFTIHALLRARSFSILGDAPCYFFNQRSDGTNISQERVDPVAHLAHLGEIVDLVERETEPGELRDRIVRRFYRAEALARLTELTYLDLPADDQVRLFDAVRDFANARIDVRLDRDLGIVTAIRSSLVRAGRQAQLLELARRAARVDVRAELRAARWSGGSLLLHYEAYLVRDEGTPLVVVERDGRDVLDPALTDGITDGPVDVTPARRGVRATPILREAESALEWFVSSRSAVDLVDAGHADDGRRRRPTVRGSLSLDPQRVGSGERPLEPGTWRLSIRMSALGIERTAPLTLSTDSGNLPAPAVLGSAGQVVIPGLGEAGGLELSVGAGFASLTGPALAALERATRDQRPAVLRDGRVVELALPIVADGRTHLPATLLVGEPPTLVRVPATIVPARGRAVLRADLASAARALGTGHHALEVELAPELHWPAGALVQAADGTARVVGLPRIPRARQLRREMAWLRERGRSVARIGTRRAIGGLESFGRRAFRRLPAPLRGPAAAAYRRVRR